MIILRLKPGFFQNWRFLLQVVLIAVAVSVVIALGLRVATEPKTPQTFFVEITVVVTEDIVSYKNY